MGNKMRCKKRNISNIHKMKEYIYVNVFLKIDRYIDNIHIFCNHGVPYAAFGLI